MRESYTETNGVHGDQAAGLRVLARQRRSDFQAKKRAKLGAMTRVMSFTSGKGGVGKTNTVVNVAMALANLGQSVLILDADLGLANIDILLGLTPKYTIADVLAGRRTLDEVVVDTAHGISVIPAASGVDGICDLRSDQKMLLLQAIEGLAADYDYLLIDTRAGISSDVLSFNSAAGEIVVVIQPEPTSLTDAYALMKVLVQHYGEKRFLVVANEVHSEREGMQAFQKLARAVGRYLHVDIRYMGSIPADPLLQEAVREQRPVLERFPTSPAGLAFAALTKRLDAEFNELRVKGGMQLFFQQLLERSVHG